MEIWKDVKGYEGFYQVSNEGRVRSLDRYVNNSRTGEQSVLRKGKVKKQSKHHGGYLIVEFNRDGKMCTKLVHRLVAEAFCERASEDLTDVNHKDENKENNRAENLEWCTKHYNVTYGTRVERAVQKRSFPVTQYSVDGEYIKRYGSISEAAREIGGSPSNIMYACKGRFATMYGYIWRLE